MGATGEGPLMAAGEIHVQLSVDYADDPKIIAAGERAEVLFLRALCLMKRTLSDGFVHDNQLARFGLPGVKARADALVREGLWERVDAGYLCPSFLKRNKSRAEVEELSRIRAEAGAKGGAKRKQVAEQIDGLALPIDRDTGTDSASAPFEAEFDAAWVDYPKKDARKAALKAYQARRREGIAAEDLALAVKHYAEACANEGRERQYVLNGSTFFGPNERWRDYLEPPATGRNGQERALGWDPSELRR